MRKPLVVVPLMGMGYVIAYTPSVWTVIVCLIPILAFSLLVAGLLTLRDKDDDS